MNPMLVVGLAVGVPLLIILIWFIAVFNAFVRLRQHCDESWSGIENELQRRYDLIPNLVETVKGYAAHEKLVLERVVEARARAMANHGTPCQQATDENRMIDALGGLFAVAEAYPDLKASNNFLALQQELVTTENRIARSRRFYNANVRDLNTLAQSFPSMIVARVASVSQREFFEISDSAVRAAPTASFSS